MANWKLYLRDYMSSASVLTPSYMMNGRNACTGLPSSIASITGASAGVKATFAANTTIRAIAIDAHNLDGCTVKGLYGSGSTQWGSTQTVVGNGPQVFDLGSTKTDTIFSLGIYGATGKTVGNLGLLGGLTGEYIEFSGSWITYPIGRQMDAHIGIQRTGTGVRIEQRRGGASQIMACHVVNVQPNATAGTQATNEGLIDNTFLLETYGVQGWLGPLWLVDDAGTSYHCHVVRPLNFPFTAAGGFAEFDLVIETIPTIGGS
jgi:hypothetical protein